MEYADESALVSWGHCLKLGGKLHCIASKSLRQLIQKWGYVKP